MQPVAAARFAPTLLTWIALAVAGLYPIDNPDTFGHLALGRQIAELGRVPALDSFSYFRGVPAPYVNYEWLSDLLFFAVYRAGGWSALHGLKLALLAVLAYLLVRMAEKQAAHSGAWLVPLFTVACLPAIRFRLSVRPHLFGLVFAALLIFGIAEILTQRERRGRIAWAVGLGAIHVLWVNLHGSHLLGVALVSLAMVSCLGDREALAPLGLLLLLMLAASCVSPYGPRIVLDAIAHTLDPRYRGLIDEWQPFRASLSLWYLVPLLWQAVWVLVSFWLRPPNSSAYRRFEALSMLLLLLMAAGSTRFFSDVAALSVPVIANGVAPAWQHWKRRGLGLGFLGALAMTLAIAGCLALPPGAQFGVGVSSRGRPAASAEWLAKELPRARIFATMADAWDLMFSLPDAKFLVDGRSTFYGPEHLQRIQRAWANGAELRRLIDISATDVVVLQPAIAEQQIALHTLLEASDFRLVLIEAEHCVFARDTPERAPMLEKKRLRVLQPGYEPGWLLSSTTDVSGARAELARLPAHPNVAAYRDWIEAMLALRPYARAGAQAGFGTPETPAQMDALRSALQQLRSCDEALPHVQTVTVYRALAALALCQLDEAEDAFARALETGSVREIGFGEQELALRRGDRDQVARFVDRTRQLPEARDDAWLAALANQL
ncbi:MAG TPA: hypothetical protein VFN67_20845, partial [Polyangiales bacterium]|nr:hypothetical protein [Polyangiales bacterium]